MLIKTMAGVFVLLALPACDPQRIAELEEGVSTEADVRARFGAPETIWDGAGGECFGPDERVLRSGTGPDLEAPAHQGAEHSQALMRSAFAASSRAAQRND